MPELSNASRKARRKVLLDKLSWLLCKRVQSSQVRAELLCKGCRAQTLRSELSCCIPSGDHAASFSCFLLPIV